MSGLEKEESLSMSDDGENWVPIEESLNMFSYILHILFSFLAHNL